MKLITLDQAYDMWYKFKNKNIYFIKDVFDFMLDNYILNKKYKCPEKFINFIDECKYNNYKII